MRLNRENKNLIVNFLYKTTHFELIYPIQSSQIHSSSEFSILDDDGGETPSKTNSTSGNFTVPSNNTNETDNNMSNNTSSDNNNGFSNSTSTSNTGNDKTNSTQSSEDGGDADGDLAPAEMEGK